MNLPTAAVLGGPWVTSSSEGSGPEQNVEYSSTNRFDPI
jgi:hypothetical protein